MAQNGRSINKTIDLLDEPYLTSFSLKLLEVPKTNFM
jgi:hypothetical protein